MTQNKFLKDRSGIYGIRNIINGKIYVGKTQCMYDRCGQYIYDFKVKRIGHLNDYLYNAISKIGIENFEFFPLEYCDFDNLPERELYWITRLNSLDRNIGYNLRLDSSSGMLVNEETALKISNNLKRQWESGIRDGHSDKMKKNWNNNTERKNNQSKLFTKLRTKYEYIVTFPNNLKETCTYKRLKELGLNNIIATLHKSKSNMGNLKGYYIVRIPLGEI